MGPQIRPGLQVQRVILRTAAHRRYLVERCGRAAARVVPRSPAVAIAVPRRMVTALAASAGVIAGRQSLDDPVAGEHASIDGKVTAHHEGTHGSVLLSQHIRLVCEVRLILTAVDQHEAGVATVTTVTLVHGVGPSSSPAEAFKVLHVEAAHGGRGVVAREMEWSQREGWGAVGVWEKVDSGQLSTARLGCQKVN